MIKLDYNFSGDHWIDRLDKDQAYDIADRIEKYMREHDEWNGRFTARACKMLNTWSVHLGYRLKSVGVHSYADLYIRMRECDAQLKKILTEVGIELNEES